jgi:hypothetical protein
MLGFSPVLENAKRQLLVGVSIIIIIIIIGYSTKQTEATSPKQTTKRRGHHIRVPGPLFASCQVDAATAGMRTPFRASQGEELGGGRLAQEAARENREEEREEGGGRWAMITRVPCCAAQLD